VLLGPIISRFFACSNEEKNKQKQQRVLGIVLSLCLKHTSLPPFTAVVYLTLLKTQAVVQKVFTDVIYFCFMKKVLPGGNVIKLFCQ
jgi:hypothetical protein